MKLTPKADLYHLARTGAGFTQQQQQVDGGPLRVGVATVPTHLVDWVLPQPLRHLAAAHGAAD